jgi:hypothetical protein
VRNKLGAVNGLERNETGPHPLYCLNRNTAGLKNDRLIGKLRRLIELVKKGYVIKNIIFFLGIHSKGNNAARSINDAF